MITFLISHVSFPVLPGHLDLEFTYLVNQLGHLLEKTRIFHFQGLRCNLVVSELSGQFVKFLLLLDGLSVVQIQLILVDLLLKVDFVIIGEGLCGKHFV